jgi:tRNA pseudouridine55 synthase
MNWFGFLCCDKPSGRTSRDVVNAVQRRLRGEYGRRDLKIGHAGTLDPLASGVLVLGIGPAVRLVPYVQQQPKHYRANFRLGQSTQSGDLEGAVTRHPELPQPTRQQLDQAAQGLQGTIQQTPPAHSAVWVDGQRAYKRIRAGESFQMPSRTVDVYSLQVLSYQFPELELDVVCGSGTYIRSLGLDLAVAAGSIAVMSNLVRLGVGPFVLEQALSIDQLRETPLPSLLLPPTLAVGHLSHIIVDQDDSQRLGHGLAVTAAGPESHLESAPYEAAAITKSGELRAIVRWKRDAWHPYRVFPVS